MRSTTISSATHEQLCIHRDHFLLLRALPYQAIFPRLSELFFGSRENLPEADRYPQWPLTYRVGSWPFRPRRGSELLQHSERRRVVLGRRLRGFLEAVSLFPFLKLLEALETENAFRTNASAEEEVCGSLQTIKPFPKRRQVPAPYYLHRLFLSRLVLI